MLAVTEKLKNYQNEKKKTQVLTISVLVVYNYPII